MTIPSASTLAKLRAATASWFSQVVFYLVLVVVFSVINQPVVFIDRLGNAGVGGYLLGGLWIPGLANAIVIVVATRARTLIGYLITSAVLTYVLAIAYYFLAGLNIYDRDPMGVLSLLIIWMIAWFWIGVIGLAIKFMVRRQAWYSNSNSRKAQ